MGGCLYTSSFNNKNFIFVHICLRVHVSVHIHVHVSVHVHVCYFVAKMQSHIWGSDNITMQFVYYYSVGVCLSDPELERLKSCLYCDIYIKNILLMPRVAATYHKTTLHGTHNNNNFIIIVIIIIIIIEVYT